MKSVFSTLQKLLSITLHHIHKFCVASMMDYKEFTNIYKFIQKSFYVHSQFYGNMNEKKLLKLNPSFSLSRIKMKIQSQKV